MSQPAGPHSVKLTIGRIEDATDRLLASASALSDEQIGEPSLLPGWSRGHVLTHIARNADGLGNLLTWAQTGVETPQYASLGDRAAQIEAGAAGPPGSSPPMSRVLPASSPPMPASLLTRPGSPRSAPAAARPTRPGSRCTGACSRSRSTTRTWPPGTSLPTGQTGSSPASYIGSSSDLAVNPATPIAVLNDASTGRQYFLRPDVTADLEISGPGHALLAWLLGRDGGTGLSADPAGPLPTIPPYG